MMNNEAASVVSTGATVGTSSLHNIPHFTAQQIEKLQGQIREFKNLCKKHNDLAANNITEVKSEVLASSVPKSVNTIEETQTVVAEEKIEILKEEELPPAQRNTPALSWQCSNSLLFSGPNRPPDNFISVVPSYVGPFAKAPDLPVVLTIPFVATFREHSYHKQIEAANTDDIQSRIWAIQRQTRALLLENYLSDTESATKSQQSTSALLLQRKNYVRNRKQSKRDIKIQEKEQKKRKQEREENRRRKQTTFLRAVLAHREEFLKYHKSKRNECSKVSRMVKQWVENVEVRKEKNDIRAESRRIQALKENDMEAYSKLVEETKNVRLQFLLSETDKYIATINRMVCDQQRTQESQASEDPENIDITVHKIVANEGDSTSRGTELSKEYIKSTHRKVEKVVQPHMLRIGDLKEYQLSGLQWLVSLYNNGLNGILADEMGLGKTIQTIALLAYIMEFKNNKGPFLIVVPLSTLSNWVNELSKWAPEMIKIIYKGAPLLRKQIFREEVESGEFNVLLTTYEYVMRDKAALRKLLWQYIIVDEGHRMKNAQSKFAQILGTFYQSKHRLLLTGTPLQNSIPELWALLNFLLPSIFSSVDTFDQWFNKPFSSFKAAGPGAPSAAAAAASADGSEGDAMTNLSQEERLLIVHRLHEVLRPFMLRRVKDQVLDQLPEKVEKVLRCELSGWQRKLYKVIHRRTIINKDGTIGAGLNNVIMQLRKVCNHPYLFLTDWLIDNDMIRSSGKFELLDRMLPKLKAAGHRVLIFSQMTQLMTILEKFFEYRQFSYLRLDGGTVSEDREKRMFMFNDEDSPYFIFLLSTRAGGLGLNLATADTVILFDSDWNPMMDAQAQDRAHRIGQKNEVRVFRLITNSPMEEKILSRATDKRNLTGLVVEAGKFHREEAEMDKKEMMADLLKEWSEEVEEEGEEKDAEIPDEDQINEMMAIFESEIELYQEMDKVREERTLQQWQQQHLQQGTPLSDIPPVQPALMSADEMPLWAQSSSAWYNKHAQLLVSLLQADTEELDRPDKAVRKAGRDEDGDDEEGHEGGAGSDGDEAEGSVSAVGSEAGTTGYRRIKKKPKVVAANNNSNSRLSGLVEEGVGAEEEEEGEETERQQQPSIGGGKRLQRKSKKRKNIIYDENMSDAKFFRLIAKEGGGEGEKPGAVGRPPGKPQRGRPSLKYIPSTGNLDIHLVKEIIKIINDVQKIQNSQGYLMSELFKTQPDRKLYPDYYRIVTSPVAFKDILAKLRDNAYLTLKHFEAELLLMCHNARLYNGDTAVYRDSEWLRKEIYIRLGKVIGKYSQELSWVLPAREPPSVDAFEEYATYLQPPKQGEGLSGNSSETTTRNNDTTTHDKTRSLEDQDDDEDEVDGDGMGRQEDDGSIGVSRGVGVGVGRDVEDGDGGEDDFEFDEEQVQDTLGEEEEDVKIMDLDLSEVHTNRNRNSHEFNNDEEEEVEEGEEEEEEGEVREDNYHQETLSSTTIRKKTEPLTGTPKTVSQTRTQTSGRGRASPKRRGRKRKYTSGS